MRRIQIKWAEWISDRIGAEAVVVLAFDGDQFAATSYGATRAKCAAAGRWIDDLSDRLGSGELPAPRLRSDNPLQEIDNPTGENGPGVRTPRTEGF
jgi:hypothetical protein